MRVTGVGRLAQEHVGPFRIPANATPGGQTVAETDLRPDMITGGGPPEPDRRLGVILGNEAPLGMGHAEEVHGLGVALARGLAEASDTRRPARDHGRSRPAGLFHRCRAATPFLVHARFSPSITVTDPSPVPVRGNPVGAA